MKGTAMIYALMLAGVASVIFQGCSISPVASASAGEAVPPGRGLPSATYYKPNPLDGAPIDSRHCGYNVTRKGWISRDLGQGVNVEVGVSGEEGKPVMAAFLLRHYDGTLTLSPDSFQLRTPLNGMTYAPSRVERKNYEPASGTCHQLGEWVHVTFPVRAERAESVELLLPQGSVMGREPIKVRPFRFQRTNE